MKIIVLHFVLFLFLIYSNGKIYFKYIHNKNINLSDEGIVRDNLEIFARITLAGLVVTRPALLLLVYHTRHWLLRWLLFFVWASELLMNKYI